MGMKQREMMMAVSLAQAKDRFEWYSAFLGTVAVLGEFPSFFSNKSIYTQSITDYIYVMI